jgi:hypothetical protein
LAWGGTAGASYREYSALDQVAQLLQIPITNPGNGVNLNSVVYVASATLDTTKHDGNADQAPRGKIYLSLQMSSGPVQHQYGQSGWGSFFSGITPLPATALRYVAASGRSYAVSRVDPIDQTNNDNATTDDGLVDATYYFTVPISNRRGTVVISPCHAMGSEYTGFVGGRPVPLNVGGPTRIALDFPAKLTETKPATKVKVAVGNSATTFASAMNLLSTLLAALLVGLVVLSRRRKRRRSRQQPAVVVEGITKPQPHFRPWSSSSHRRESSLDQWFKQATRSLRAKRHCALTSLDR